MEKWVKKVDSAVKSNNSDDPCYKQLLFLKGYNPNKCTALVPYVIQL